MSGWRARRGRRRIVICSWRDESHPDAGGSERYVGEVARHLASQGNEVVVLTAAHGRGPRDEVLDGVRWRRRGGRFTVFARALLQLPFLRPDVVVDVQNGIPFAARLATRAPVVVLVHHVHREVWPVALGPWAGRVGWWVESWLAPRLLRGCPYVAVSRSTATELSRLGVPLESISVIHNGRDLVPVDVPRSQRPTVCVVGRLVPHKQVEHAVAAVHHLRQEGLDVELDVIGDGYWRPQLAALVERLGMTTTTHLHGYVPEAEKHRLMARSWVHLCPSLKEGWGLVVIEAASHGVPTIAYRDAGGVTESVLDGETGVLVSDPADLTRQLRLLLTDSSRRAALGDAAREYADSFRWADTGEAFDKLLLDAEPAPGRVSDSRRSPTAG